MTSWVSAVGLDGLGDEAAIPGAPGRFDLGLAVGAGGLGFLENPLVGPGQHDVGEARARCRDAAAGQVERGRALPFLTEQRLDPADGLADHRHQRIAALGIADGVFQDLARPHRAVVAQQPHPGVEGPRHDRGQQAGAGHEIQALGPVVRDGRARGCHALAADHLRLAGLLVVEDDRHLAARPVQVGLHHLEHEAGGHRRVEGVAALLENRHTARGRKPVGGRDDPEGAADFGSGCKHDGDDYNDGRRRGAMHDAAGQVCTYRLT